MLKFQLKAKDKSELTAGILVQEMSSTLTLLKRRNDSGSHVLLFEFRKTFEFCVNKFLAAVFIDIWKKGEITNKMKLGVLTKYNFRKENGED